LSSRSSSDSSIKKPHHKRKARWDQLNAVLVQNKKRNSQKDSTGYSHVSWNDVRSIFTTIPYNQPTKDISQEAFKVISDYLSFVGTCSSLDTSSGKESQRLHFIAPILYAVCFLFGGDVKVEVEEDLDGEMVKAHGHFEFVLRRGNKRVCIVEAKKENFEQGFAQDLIGCEVAADIDGLDIVYGIVTNYYQWMFFRSLNESIEKDQLSLDTDRFGIPSSVSLAKITGKIYGMLSDSE
jgi:hypothetical protein